MASWVEDIRQALINLGGQATLSQIYEEVRRIRKEPLPESWQANIRERIEAHSSDSKNFKGKDLFRKMRTGTWALQDHVVSRQVVTPPLSKQERPKPPAPQVLESYGDIVNILNTINQYRDYTQPGSPTWNEYVQECFHILGFGTKVLSEPPFLLLSLEFQNSPVAIVNIVNPDADFVNFVPALSWDMMQPQIAISQKVNWAILTDGVRLKITRFQSRGGNHSNVWTNFDDIICSQSAEAFFAIYMQFAAIQGKGEGISPKKEKGQTPRTKRTMSSSDYDLSYHLENKPSYTAALFDALRARIFSLSDSIEEKINKFYIGYSEGKNFCEIHFLSDRLKIWIGTSIEELSDPFSICRDVRHVGHYGTGDTEILFSRLEEIDKIFDLVNQAYDRCRAR